MKETAKSVFPYSKKLCFVLCCIVLDHTCVHSIIKYMWLSSNSMVNVKLMFASCRKLGRFISHFYLFLFSPPCVILFYYYFFVVYRKKPIHVNQFQYVVYICSIWLLLVCRVCKYIHYAWIMTFYYVHVWQNNMLLLLLLLF